MRALTRKLPRPTQYFFGTILLLLGGAIAFIVWKCAFDPNVFFLSRDQRADWIVFASPVEAWPQVAVSLDATFRRDFVLDHAPRRARLIFRAARRAEVQINGVLVDSSPVRTWKEKSAIDVLRFLHAGQNHIQVRVFNDGGPPALWLALETDVTAIETDRKWEASFAGSSWRGVALASDIRIPGPGNSIAGGEKVIDVLPAIWRSWLIFLILAVAICVVVSKWRERWAAHDRMTSVALLLFLACLWVVLFWHNDRLMPYSMGFDSGSHLNYIKYVQEHRALPWPTDGFEMFQPPLYYIVSAAALSAVHYSTADSSGIILLRGMTMLFGIAHFIVVFLTLRLLLPSQPAKQLIGLLLAAFLPMQLFLSHFATNETLAALMASVTLYLAVRILQRSEPSAALYGWLGLALGAAMLSKATGVLLIAPILAACAIKLTEQRARPVIWLRAVGLMLLICFAVCGWHYLRIWHRFGTPLLGNWDAASGFAWWQDPGYRTLGYYLHFGRSLSTPLFSGVASFWDGIYSTLWGDGLCGGVSSLAYRPPWNYNFLIAGYWLAIVPTFLIGAGIATAAYRAVQKPSATGLLMLTFSILLSLGLIFMTLRVASYAQVKAFYGLSILIPLCLGGALGWQTITRGRRILQIVLSALLLLWAMNSYASVWIRDSASTHTIASARMMAQGKKVAAVTEARMAVQRDPASARVRQFLTLALEDTGDLDEAASEAEKAVALSPSDSLYHVQLGEVLDRQGQRERATSEARLAIELGPENTFAYDLLLTCLDEAGQTDEAIHAGRERLVMQFARPDAHFELGVALRRSGDFPEAANQFAYALMMRKDWSDARSDLRAAILSISQGSDGRRNLEEAAAAAPDSSVMLDELAWLLATHSEESLRDGPTATRLAERACYLTGNKDPLSLAALAVGSAETGDFPKAIDVTKRQITVAESAGDRNMIALGRELLSAFSVNKPYRSPLP